MKLHEETYKGETTKESATDNGNQQKRTEFRKKLFLLTITGSIVFWITTFATSLLPLAAAYRAAYSNWSIQTVWVGSVFAGMLFSCCVSFFYLRFFNKIPTKSPVLKSLLVSNVALVIAILIIDVPIVLQSEQIVLHFFYRRFVQFSAVSVTGIYNWICI